MPSITVALIEGRTLDQKRQLVTEITKVVCDICKVQPEAVSVRFEEMRREDYAKAGVLYADQGK